MATESNPPGDIPDNQAYVAFQGAGFAVKVPEGWARTVTGTTTAFTDKLNRIETTPSSMSAAPTPQSAQTTVVAELSRSVPRFAMGKVSEITRSAGKVVLVTYQGDSAQDPVTGKVVRDAFERYLFYRGGKQVALTLVGPANADNVDPWKTVSDSFRWA
ncbi:lipoprotein [Kribbella aluminosa]